MSKAGELEARVHTLQTIVERQRSEDAPQTVDLADEGDERVFQELYATCPVTASCFADPEKVKDVCKLWFGRGIAQGLKWGGDALDRSRENRA